MIQSTSLHAYNTEVRPTLGARQKTILEAIQELQNEHENATNTEISEHLNFPINTVTPRVFELRQKGYLTESVTRPCRATGRRAKTWRVVFSRPKQQTLV